MRQIKQLIRRFAPGATTTIRLFRQLRTTGARGVFVRRILARSLLRRQERLPAPARHNPLIIFVCHGNIMRSALAEAALRSGLGPATDIRVASAGVAAIPDNPADPRAVAYARSRGLALESHKAQRLTPALLAEADFLFALDRLIEAEVVALDPTAASRTLLLGGISESGRYQGIDIPDPFMASTEEVTRAFESVERVVGTLLRRLAPRPQASA